MITVLALGLLCLWTTSPRCLGMRPFLPLEPWLLVPLAPAPLDPHEDPLAAFQGKPAWRHRLDADFDLLLKDRRPQSLHDYRRHGMRFQSRGRWRDTPVLIAAGRQRTEARQRAVYADDDRMRADLNADFVRLGAALRWRSYFLELGAGGGRGLEAGLALTRVFGAGRLRLAADLERSAWELDQSFSGQRYLFSFPFRRERLDLRFDPAIEKLPRLSYLREVDVDEAEKTGDWNQLYVRREGLALSWPASAASPFALDLDLQWGGLDLAMFADGVPYLRLSDMSFRVQTGELRIALPRVGGRARLGHREIRTDLEEAYFEPWPFNFWDVFQNNRYVVDGLHYRLTLWSLGYGRDFVPRPGSRAGFVLSHVWLTGKGALDWKERVPVLPPFFYRWDRHHESVPLPASHALRLDLSGALDLAGGWRMSVQLTQHLPLRGTTDGDSPGPSLPGGDRFRYGGFHVTLALESGR